MKTRHKNQRNLATETIRSFLAIPCPLTRTMQPLFSDLERTSQIRSTRLRVLTDANLHLTLQFLGSVSETSLANVVDAVNLCLPAHDSFELNLRSIGFFRESMWLGIEESNPLEHLVMDIKQNLKGLGIKLDDKAFHPHITVARFGKGAKSILSRFQQRYLESTWGSLNVKQFHLYRSETLPQGARYSVLHSFPLGFEAEDH